MTERPRDPSARPRRRLVPAQRVFALTDGVVAIAMTLLVLGIELPEGLRGAELRQAVGELLSQVGTFLLSAVVIALFWRAHHAVLRDVERIDARLFWLNVAFLALVSLIPFPTAVLQDYGDEFVGPGLYGAVIGTASTVLYAMEADIARRTAGAWWRRVPFPAEALVFLLSVGIAAVSPTAAIWSWAAAVPLAVLESRPAARARRR
ncbi:TMEM175 family protein [Streptomyces glaucosporus]|uniref:TMEM175 family protein n=1 Tax=Streptomyces glaucosporus TaxID=284044 RepID=A0ABP5VGX5_9ACTN